MVVRAVHQHTGAVVAIKKISGAFEDVVQAKRLLRELRCTKRRQLFIHADDAVSFRILRLVNHQCIISRLDMPLVPCLGDGSRAVSDVYIYTPCMDTDLNRIIQSDRHLTEEIIYSVAYQLLCGLSYLHAANVMHRDVKPQNVLIGSSWHVKLCDFGSARTVENSVFSDCKTEYVVTRWYRAPEVILASGNYAESVDIWACACTIAEIFLRAPLFPGRNYTYVVYGGTYIPCL
jgi:mitogen-activated protein kinase 1/3